MLCQGFFCLNNLKTLREQSGTTVQFSHVRLFATPWNTYSTPSFPVHHYLPELAQTHVHWVDNAIQPLHPPVSLSPPAFNLSRHQGLLYESALHIRWPKYWSFSFCISPSNEHPGLISFRMDWLDLLAVQGTLKSLLQHHTSKASILQHSAFLIVQLNYWKNHSFDYMDLSQHSNVSAF